MIAHIFSNILSLCLSHFAWNASKNAHHRNIFVFEKKTKVFCWFSVLLFPLVLAEPDFQKPLSVFCVLCLEVVGLVCALYVSTMRIVLCEEHFERTAFFYTRRVFYHDISEILIRKNCKTVIVKSTKNERIEFSMEIPHSAELIKFLQGKISGLNKL